MSSVIKRTKNNKAAGDDDITNEMIKSSGIELRNLMLKVFNCCLKNNCFPWKHSIIVPLHKKGPIDDPDNYRPISISSALGKIFSHLLLLKLQQERTLLCPGAINQAGFCKGSMTMDHILTLQTIVEKYKKVKRSVYGAFINYRKAFDTVWREGLMLKLAQLKIDSNLMKTINEYYSERTASVKIGSNTTDNFATVSGVIQGEPASPELFKIFIHDLSDQLDEACALVPELNGIKISHLLWADDLFVNALTAEGLQILLDILHEFCEDWGLTPNPIKCNVIIFNNPYATDETSLTFKLGAGIISMSDSYTYLGLEITSSMNLKHSMEILAKKGKRAMGALMSAIERSIISPVVAL